MRLTIHKYPIEVTDYATITMPTRSRLLSVQVRNGVPCVWALVDPTAELVERRLRVFGTGHPVDVGGGCPFVGTFQLHGGALVFHVFDQGE